MTRQHQIDTAVRRAFRKLYEHAGTRRSALDLAASGLITKQQSTAILLAWDRVASNPKDPR